MKKIIFYLLAFNYMFAQSVEKINVARFEYGAKTTAKNVIDNSVGTVENVNKFVVNFAAETKIESVEMKIKPASGKLIFKSTLNGNNVILKEVQITEKDENISFSLENIQLNGVIVEWVPADGKTPLAVADFGAYTSDKNTISYYNNDIKPYVQKYVNPDSLVINQPAETIQTTAPTVAIRPVAIPFESISFPQARPISN